MFFFNSNNQPVESATGVSLESLAAIVQAQASQIASMQRTIEAQERKIEENAREIAVLSPDRDETPSYQSVAGLTPETPSLSFSPEPRLRAFVQADIYKTRRLIPEDMAEACREIEDFHSKYGTYFMNADKILQSLEIMRVMDLYAELESTQIEWQLCRQTIDT